MASLFSRLWLAPACALGVLYFPYVSAADTSIKVQYRDKPPYSYTRDGKPVGFLMERTIGIFNGAGVPMTAEEVPVKRITRDIQNNGSAICSPGWYKLPERETFALFSLPIHEDKPQMALGVNP